MFVILWTYEIAEEHRGAFESAYGPDGVWVRFFREGAGYLGTELLRSDTNRYVVATNSKGGKSSIMIQMTPKITDK